MMGSPSVARSDSVENKLGIGVAVELNRCEKEGYVFRVGRGRERQGETRDEERTREGESRWRR